MYMQVADLSRTVWRKSSYSGDGVGSNCVEVTFTDTTWRKSSYSGDGVGSACVEVAFGGAAVGVRDSKSPGAGSLVFPAESWSAFLR